MKIEEALQKFVDNKEDCTITLKDGFDVNARITEIGDDFIRVEEDGGLIERVINTRYVVSVQVYHVPEKKKKDKKGRFFNNED